MLITDPSTYVAAAHDRPVDLSVRAAYLPAPTAGRVTDIARLASRVAHLLRSAAKARCFIDECPSCIDERRSIEEDSRPCMLDRSRCVLGARRRARDRRPSSPRSSPGILDRDRCSLEVHATSRHRHHTERDRRRTLPNRVATSLDSVLTSLDHLRTSLDPFGPAAAVIRMTLA